MSLFVHARCTEIWLITDELNKIAQRYSTRTIKRWQVVPEAGLGPKDFYVIVELIPKEEVKL